MDIANDKLKYRNSLQNEYNTKAATRAFKLQQVQGRLEDLTISLGNFLLPVIDKLAPKISAVATGFTELMNNSETARTVLKDTAMAIGGIVALKATVGTFKYVKSLVSDLAQLGKIGKAKLGGTTDHTAASANRAAAALARMNRQLDQIGGSGRSGGGRGRGRPVRRRGRGIASTDTANIMGLGSPKMAARIMAPLALAEGAFNTADLVMNGGSAADVGGAVGSTGGVLAGSAMGAAIGTAILPGIGTAVGGAVGGLAGSELGQKLGEVVGPYIKEGWEGLKGWFSGNDKTTPASDKTAIVQPKDLAKVSKNSLTSGIDASVEKAKKDQPPPAPNIILKVENNQRFDVKASGDPAQDNALAAKIQAIMEVTQTKALHEALSQVSGPDARLNASLSGQRTD